MDPHAPSNKHGSGQSPVEENKLVQGVIQTQSMILSRVPKLDRACDSFPVEIPVAEADWIPL